MFSIFKKKSEVEKLQDEYNRLLAKAYQLSTSNRKESDKYRAKANEVGDRMEELLVQQKK